MAALPVGACAARRPSGTVRDCGQGSGIRGQLLDGPGQGPVPGPWSITANYDECMREWGQNPRTFQKREFHQGDPPTITSAWVFRSPFDRRLKLLSFGWYATGRQASRAHWREVTATQTAHL